MFKVYWGMSKNPFTREIGVDDVFISEDIRQVKERLEHVRRYPGIAVITAYPGSGKTLGIRIFTTGLNPNLYRVVYMKITNVSEAEFFRMLARKLGLEPAYRKGDNIQAINERMKKLARDQKVMPVIVVDEAQGIKRGSGYFLSFQEMMNFEMDSQNYGILILSGHPVLNDTLNLEINEAFNQRIVVNYDFQGMSEKEVGEYVRSRMLLADATPEVFDPAAITALHESCQKSVRRLNRLCRTALLIGANEKARTVTADIVREAALEVSLFRNEEA